MGTNAELLEVSKTNKKRHATAKYEAYNRLFELRRWIASNTTTTLEDITSRKVTTIEEVKFHCVRKFGMTAGIKEKYLRVKGHMETYMENSNAVQNYKTIINTIDKQYEEYNMFSYVVTRFNELIYDALLDGYVFDMIDGVGDLYFILKDKKPVRANDGSMKFPIDWNESLKLKQEIIDSGKTPYDKFNAPNGEKYMMYHTEPYPYLVWTKTRQSGKSNIANYSLTPSRRGLLKLNTRLKNDKFATINYKRN